MKDETKRLTKRELEIISLLYLEYSNKEVAAALTISEKTVETHRKRIYKKIKARNVIGLIKYVHKTRLI